MSLLKMKNIVLVVVTLMIAPCVFMDAGAEDIKVGCDGRKRKMSACMHECEIWLHADETVGILAIFSVEDSICSRLHDFHTRMPLFRIFCLLTTVTYH